MWIFTKHGFFSAVCARQGDGRHGQPVDPDRMMVRARNRGHLEAAEEAVRRPARPVRHSGVGRDRLRLPTLRQQGGVVPGAFRPGRGNRLRQLQVGGRPPPGRAGAAYERSLHEVWSVMHQLQK